MSGRTQTDGSSKNLATAIQLSHRAQGEPAYAKPVKIRYARLQRNGHSCMDYCLQRTEKDVGLTTPLTHASTAPAMLRSITHRIRPRITAETRRSAQWARSRRQVDSAKTYTPSFVQRLNRWVNQLLDEVPQAA